MRTALTDDDSLDCLTAARAGLTVTPEDVELITVAALMFGDGIKIGFTGPQ